jgi:hypothetical protein
MRAEDRQSRARRDFEKEQAREGREGREMVMADIDSAIIRDKEQEDADNKQIYKKLRQEREQQRFVDAYRSLDERSQMRDADRQSGALRAEQEREMGLLIRGQERQQLLEDEQLQQLLDDAGELVEGADERDLVDFNPDRYDRERDFDRERDYE